MNRAGHHPKHPNDWRWSASSRNGRSSIEVIERGTGPERTGEFGFARTLEKAGDKELDEFLDGLGRVGGL